MNDKEFFDILSKNINFVIVDNMIISGGTFEIEIMNNEYKTKHLLHNSEKIKLKDTKINYNCICGNENITILLKRFLSKKSLKCRICKENDKEKRNKQSQFLKNTFKKYGKIKSLKTNKKIKINNIDLIEKSNFLFDNENSTFKKNYNKKHLSEDEYEKIKSNLIKINNIPFNNEFVYFHHILTNNQQKYSSYLYDKKNDLLINFNKITYKCDNCNKYFKTSRSPIERKNDNLILCKECSFSNKTFKKKSIFNIKNQKIIYQSKPEKQLIDYCNKKNILIENGPILSYFFNDIPTELYESSLNKKATRRL